MTSEYPPSFTGLLRKHWLRAILLLILAFEIPVLLYEGAQAAGNWVQDTLNGKIQPECPTLVGTTVSHNGGVRGILFACPNGPAFVSFPSWSSSKVPITLAVPTFSPPPGLLGLYLIDPTSDSCPIPIPLTGPPGYPPLYPGMTKGFDLTGSAEAHNYCAVVSSSAGVIAGFSIKWSLGSPSTPLSPPSFTLSAHNTTVMAGQNTTVALNVTSVRGFNGTVWFNAGVPSPAFSVYFKPESLILKSQGSNQTLVTVEVGASVPRGTYAFGLHGNHGYDLVDYGAFSGGPLFVQAMTVIYVQVR